MRVCGVVTGWPFAPFTTSDRHTYKDIHLAVEIVVNDQVVRQFETVRLHWVARAIVEVPLVGCTFTQSHRRNKRIQQALAHCVQRHRHTHAYVYTCVHTHKQSTAGDAYVRW